jgi:hypothetical protein
MWKPHVLCKLNKLLPDCTASHPGNILYSHRHDSVETEVPQTSRVEAEGPLDYSATSPTPLLSVGTKQSLAGAPVKLSPACLESQFLGHVTHLRSWSNVLHISLIRIMRATPPYQPLFFDIMAMNYGYEI